MVREIQSSAASMTVFPYQAPTNRAIRWWLIAIAALIAIMVLVGALRLTESGLDCRVETGRSILPPLNQEQWTQAFSLQSHSAISRAQRRHESRRVRDDLLVGMESPAARARDRRRLLAAVSLVPVARRERGPESGGCG
jgi:hypothetical protein